jgi:hypothetical protein
VCTSLCCIWLHAACQCAKQGLKRARVFYTHTFCWLRVLQRSRVCAVIHIVRMRRLPVCAEGATNGWGNATCERIVLTRL